MTLPHSRAGGPPERFAGPRVGLGRRRPVEIFIASGRQSKFGFIILQSGMAGGDTMRRGLQPCFRQNQLFGGAAERRRYWHVSRILIVLIFN
jgi:hypothetical protein